jgi:hypothetical protein
MNFNPPHSIIAALNEDLNDVSGHRSVLFDGAPKPEAATLCKRHVIQK